MLPTSQTIFQYWEYLNIGNIGISVSTLQNQAENIRIFRASTLRHIIHIIPSYLVLVVPVLVLVLVLGVVLVIILRIAVVVVVVEEEAESIDRKRARLKIKRVVRGGAALLAGGGWVGGWVGAAPPHYLPRSPSLESRTHNSSLESRTHKNSDSSNGSGSSSSSSSSSSSTTTTTTMMMTTTPETGGSHENTAASWEQYWCDPYNMPGAFRALGF